MQTITTPTLEIAYEQGGPTDGPAVLILHGWPDAPRGWNKVAANLQAAGYRTITPWLRGFGPTLFLDAETPRVGTAIALAQDAVDLADALKIDRFAVVGHDWGARTAYTLAALFPNRIASITALALGYQPRGAATVPSFDQARRFWYQWFMCTDGGAEKIEADPMGFARIQWDTWSPAGWFEEEEFARTAENFNNPDWLAITLNSYRSRWRSGETSTPAYDRLRARLHTVEQIAIPTLLIQGAADTCVAASESESLDDYFTHSYRRLLLDGIGHFPHREAPEPVSEAVLRHLNAHQ